MRRTHRKILRGGARAQRKLTDDRAALQHFLVQFLVFLWVAYVDACPENPDGGAVGVHRSLMHDGIDPAGHAADDDQSARGQASAKPLRQLRAVKGWPARSQNAEARKIQDLRVAPHVKQYQWIVDLQKCLRILRLGPVQERAPRNLLYARQFLLGALESLLLHDGLRDLRWEMACLRDRGERRGKLHPANQTAAARGRTVEKPDRA
jgi:hypothetical protein